MNRFLYPCATGLVAGCVVVLALTVTMTLVGRFLDRDPKPCVHGFAHSLDLVFEDDSGALIGDGTRRFFIPSRFGGYQYPHEWHERIRLIRREAEMRRRIDESAAPARRGWYYMEKLER